MSKGMKNLALGASGPLVELVQSILRSLGYYSGEVQGSFDRNTANKVTAFQVDTMLPASGEVNDLTWQALMPYVNGRTDYVVQQGDTLFRIADKFKTTERRILYANPGISPDVINVGQTIKVPFGSVIPTGISYSSSILNMNIAALKVIYPFLTIGIMGYSVTGQMIPYIKIGTGSRNVFYSGAIHANEWIVTPVLMKFIEELSLAYVNNDEIFGYPARQILEQTTIYITPMCNPDGVDLVTGELGRDTLLYQRAKWIASQYPDIPFPQGWKANLNGVDLNLQFPAGWDQAREIKAEQGFTQPAPRDYVGAAPLSEPEAILLYQFTKMNNFDLVLAYHTQGEVIYWQFMDYAGEDAYRIGQEFSKVSGYLLADVPYASSFAGYKDWFLQDYGRPGYTIEAGEGENPLPISQFDEIYRDNLGILVYGAMF
ncbi:MAG: M14 family metallopeptidase [Lachnospiraceae bacterium]